MTSMQELDFIRAMNERPLWARLLFRVVVGESAYREFLFMVSNAYKGGWDPFGDYSLHDSDYHQDPKPWRWWLYPNV